MDLNSNGFHGSLRKDLIKSWLKPRLVFVIPGYKCERKGENSVTKNINEYSN